MADYTIKQGDLEPPIEVLLTDANGAIALGTTGVTFRMLNRDLTLVFEAPATVVDAATGSVKYDWSEGDTATRGEYLAEFRIEWSTGDRPQTSPGDTWIVVLIL